MSELGRFPKTIDPLNKDLELYLLRDLSHDFFPTFLLPIFEDDDIESATVKQSATVIIMITMFSSSCWLGSIWSRKQVSSSWWWFEVCFILFRNESKKESSYWVIEEKNHTEKERERSRKKIRSDVYTARENMEGRRETLIQFSYFPSSSSTFFSSSFPSMSLSGKRMEKEEEEKGENLVLFN